MVRRNRLRWAPRVRPGASGGRSAFCRGGVRRRRRRASSARSSLVRPGASPWSIRACLTQRRTAVSVRSSSRQTSFTDLPELRISSTVLAFSSDENPRRARRRGCSMWTSLDGHHRPSVGVRRSAATPLRRKPPLKPEPQSGPRHSAAVGAATAGRAAEGIPEYLADALPGVIPQQGGFGCPGRWRSARRLRSVWTATALGLLGKVEVHLGPESPAGAPDARDQTNV